MKRTQLILTLVLTLVTTHALGLTLGSWNIRHLGWADTKKDYTILADVIAQYDVIAIQEVMYPKSVDKLVGVLNDASRENTWKAIISPKSVGTKRYREYYAFIYNTATVSLYGDSKTFPDPKDDFIREPFSAKFCEIDANCFVLSTIHLIYGKKHERVTEIEKLAMYLVSLKQSSNLGTPIFMLGDFNMGPDNSSFNGMKTLGYIPAFSKDDKYKSTLSRTEGKKSKQYDNIWINTSCTTVYCMLPTSIEVIDIPSIYGLTYKKSTSSLSDHLPLKAVFDTKP